MSHKEVELAKTFSAKGSDGRTYEICVLQDQFVGRTRSGPYRVEGHKDLQTDDGEPVNYLGKGKYELPLSGVALTSDDPDAE